VGDHDDVPRGTRWRDGREWLIGAQADVRWITDSTSIGLEITSAIPPVFEDYATILVPAPHQGRSASAIVLLNVLAEASGDQPWWLGYLDTGSADVIFPDAPRVCLYADWRYVLVQAGPMEAERWRTSDDWRAPGADLIFPFDRSWLLSWLWDDDWRCFGGPTPLVERLLNEPRLEIRRVGLTEDATPPRYTAR
jgi:hypothetical protein